MWYNKEMHIDIAHLIIVLVVILISMTLHEAMHGFMAYWLGDDTAKEQGRLTLNPLHHIDPFLTILLPLSLVGLSQCRTTPSECGVTNGAQHWWGSLDH